MLSSGCYENAFQISGVLQQFISRCVVGGRVMTNSNKMYHVKNKIDDFGACNLYPSAMYFMCAFLEGLPKVLTNISYDFLKRQDVYFIIIKIIKLNKHLDFPLTCTINEETGVIYFINEMEHDIIYFDKVGLEDLIHFMKLNLRLLIVIIVIVVGMIKLIM